MLYLKAANIEDKEKEYEAILQIPENENSYINEYYNCTREKFENIILPEMMEHSKGINVPADRVPDTYYFLWNNNEIVGLFKIRHSLNDFLRRGPGHVGYGILKQYRGRGYATKGLALAIEICKDLIEEDEIYLSVNKNNLASLTVQKNNGAYIVDEDEQEYYTRIKIR
jgi:predicted acetyltransferase